MKINHPASSVSAATAAEVARAARGAQPGKPVDAVRRVDTVRISPEGRALSTMPLGVEPDAELTPEQIAEIRLRIQEGAYNSLELVEAVARRILASGDLNTEE